MDPEFSITESLRALWRRRWLIVLPVVALVSSILLTTLVTPRYRTEALLQLNAAATQPEKMDPFSGLFISREAAPSFIELMKTPPILDQVAANLGLPGNASLGEIAVSQISKTAFLRISVEHSDPMLAADVANELAQVMRTESLLEWHERAATAAAILQVRLDSLLRQIEQTRQALAAGAGDAHLLGLQLSSFDSQYAVGLTELEATRLGTIRITDVLTVRARAATPTTPVYPRPLFNAFMAVVLGITIAIGLLFGLEYLDATKVRSPEQVRRLLGAPVIGGLPIHDLFKQRGGSAGVGSRVQDPTFLEPYHLLRTNLQFSGAVGEAQTVLVTSAEIGEGKTTIVSNLALAYAIAGQRVIAVDADMRRPNLHLNFETAAEKGLSQFLSQDDAPVDEFLSDCPLPSDAHSGSLRVLGAGTVTASPSAFLGSARMRQMLDEMKGLADVILLDSPPVLYSSDPLVIANAVDRVILVVWSGMLRNAAIQRAREGLEMVKANRVDVVLNKLRRETDTYAYYSQYYYYSEHRARADSG